jgi:hypothetical protein
MEILGKIWHHSSWTEFEQTTAAAIKNTHTEHIITRSFSGTSNTGIMIKSRKQHKALKQATCFTSVITFAQIITTKDVTNATMFQQKTMIHAIILSAWHPVWQPAYYCLAFGLMLQGPTFTAPLHVVPVPSS